MRLPIFVSLVISLTALVDSALAKTPKTPKLWDHRTTQLAAVPQITWSDNASNLRGQVNQDFAFICPPNGYTYRVWGTDVYTDDSSICNAAVHAGLITTRNGGQVTIRIRPGAGSYNGTTRNGVSTLNYGSWGGSFIFLGSTRSPGSLQWNSTASNLRGQLNQDFAFICPPNGSIYKVWGTDVYTDDSSICNAAVHAGLITTRNGGQVTIRIRPGAGFYNGTTRNGVSTLNYGSWGGSFIFLGSTRSPGSLQWNSTASNLRGQLNQYFAFICPPNGSIYKVWGTDVYTDDSSICNAAVHAGLITTRNGGQVTIRIRPGAGSYNGTTRNGVNSLNYGSWGGSFIFVR